MYMRTVTFIKTSFRENLRSGQPEAADQTVVKANASPYLLCLL
jgi:hypothetical protein